MALFSQKIIRKLRNFRENVNISIYGSKNKVEFLLKILSVMASVVGIAAFLFFHGFDNPPTHEDIIHSIFRFILIFYYVKYFIGYFYSFNPKQYFRDNNVQGILLVIILIGLIYDSTQTVAMDNIIKKVFSIDSPGVFTTFVEQSSFLLLFIIEIGKAAASMLSKVKISPPVLFVISFVVIIFIGCGLLMLPEMTVNEGSMPFVDALFTSTSACCVTGLSVVDISSYFTMRGQFVLMILIQLGGINLISFAMLFILLARRTVGIRSQALIKHSFEATNIRDSAPMIKKIFLISFSFEIIGAILIFFAWPENTTFYGIYNKIFHSVFHSIATFNNAGFSTLPDGLYNIALSHAYYLQFVMAMLIIVGGLGFPVISDILNKISLKGKVAASGKWTINTRIVVFTSLALIAFGMLCFLVLEWNNSLKDRDLTGKLMAGFFQSVSARTAGFNTVDLSMIMRPTAIMMMFLMFIGASPVSTGGGIKTSTFAVLCLSAYNIIRGKGRIDIEKTQVESTSVLRAMTILLFSVGYIMLASAVMTYIEPDIDILPLIFEQVSAFSTTGLSLGITSLLGLEGKISIIITMFMGRIGLLTFGFALANSIRPEPEYRYRKAKIIIV